MAEKKKIMVVDDDQHIAELISLYLIKEGYETMEIYDGREALEKVDTFQPDMMLLDLMLPSMLIQPGAWVPAWVFPSQ